MPIYEYSCTKCHRHFEVIQKISEKAGAECPSCGQTCKRVMSRTSFSLKGGGWYKDGYSSRRGDAKGGTKTEVKTEAKTEPKTEKKTGDK